MECTCTNVQGQLCGTHRREDLLRGNCNDGLLYYSPGINQPAQERTSFSLGNCVLGTTGGQDYCYGDTPPGKMYILNIKVEPLKKRALEIFIWNILKFSRLLKFILMIFQLKGNWLCGKVLGSHCGSRIDDGYLSTSCSRNGFFGCWSINAIAEDRGDCYGYVKGGPGNDYCPRKHQKPLNPKLVICSLIEKLSSRKFIHKN